MKKPSKKILGILLIASIIACTCLIGCASNASSQNAKNDEFGLNIEKGEVFLDYSLKAGFAVTIDFKNTYKTALPFALLYSVTATQDGEELYGSLASGTEGSEAISNREYIDPGDSAAVQETYALKSESPVIVEVRANMAAEGDEVLVSREFDVKKEYNYLKK